MYDPNFITNYLNRIESLNDSQKAAFFSKLAPLSESQKRIVEIENNIGDISNVTVLPLLISKRIEIQKIESAVNSTVRRHETMRTVFLENDGQLRQLVLPFKPCNLTAEEKPFDADASTNEQISRLVSRFESEKQDLCNKTLWRCRIYDCDAELNLVIFIFHQTIFDGLSLDNFIKELMLAETVRPDLQLQYADYARWQEKYLTAEYLKETGKKWLEKLNGINPAVEIPTDFARPQKSLCRAEESELLLSVEESRELRNFCSAHNLSVMMLGIAAFGLTVNKITNAKKIAIGIPMAGRTLPGTENLIGSFVNIAPLVIDLNVARSANELLQQVKNEMIFLQENQEFPFRQILKLLYPNEVTANYGAIGKPPLLRFFLDFKEKRGASGNQNAASDFSIFETEEKKTGSDFYLKIQDDGRLTLDLLYNAEIYREGTAVRILGRFRSMLFELCRNEKIHNIQSAQTT